MKRDKAFRLHHKERVLRNRGKDAKTFNISTKDGGLGRFKDRHPLDCGNAGCLVCHSSKVLNLKTYKQIKANIARDSEVAEEEDDEHEV
jgi:hypothetical protein